MSKQQISVRDIIWQARFGSVAFRPFLTKSPTS